MGGRPLRIAARPSPLSRAQVAEAVAAFRTALGPQVAFEFIWAETPGDRDRVTALADPSVPDDFFTRDLDGLLLADGCDLAVHSAKDLPRRLRPELAVAAFLPNLDLRDAFVLREGVPDLAAVRRVGSSTPRRYAAVRRVIRNAETVPLRGNIEQWLAALDRGDYDAIVVAACALIRLGLAERIHSYLLDAAAPLQGHLAVVARSSDDQWFAALRPLDFRQKLLDERGDVPPAAEPGRIGPRTLLILGTRPDRLAGLGETATWPMIRRRPRPLAERVAALESGLAACDAVLFASAFAAAAFVEALVHWRDVRALTGRRLLAVGPATADAMERLGLAPDHVVHDMRGVAGLAAGWPGGIARVFYPCSDRAPADERRRALAPCGVELVPVVLYETLDHCPGPLPSGFAGALFTSPSTVASFLRHYPAERGARRRWLAIGPATLAALDAAGMKGELLDDAG